MSQYERDLLLIGGASAAGMSDGALGSVPGTKIELGVEFSSSIWYLMNG